jgi:hypothetical protein
MANTSSEKFKLDVPTALKVAAIGVLIAIALVVVLNVFEISRVVFIATPLAYLLVGMLYSRQLLQRTKLSYIEAGTGGAVAGAIAGFLVIIVGSLVTAFLTGTNFSYTVGLASISEDGFAGDLLNSMVVGAALGAIGGAWILLLRTQRLEE